MTRRHVQGRERGHDQAVRIVQEDVEALIRERGHTARIWWFCHDVVLLAGLVPAGRKG